MFQWLLDLLKLSCVMILIAVAGLAADWWCRPDPFYLREHRHNCTGCRQELKQFRTQPDPKLAAELEALGKLSWEQTR